MNAQLREERVMRSNVSCVAIAVAAMSIGLVSPALAQEIAVETFEPIRIKYPGATSTQARGINTPGEVVGTYVCASSCVNPENGELSAAGMHGFLRQAGVFTRIDVPGASVTIPRGIANQGIIVGQYTLAGVTHGFTYADGDWTYPIDVPVALFDNLGSPRHTLAIGISPQGDLVGCFHEDGLTMTTMHGWLRRNGEFIKLATPHGPGDTTSYDPDTMNNGVSPTGAVVGFYFTSGVSYIADEAGVVTTFTVDGNRFTLAWGINARGDVVGSYGTNLAETGGMPLNPRGFIRSRKGEFLGLSVQGASNTQVFGINEVGDVVGQYTDTTGTHGFVYRVR
jgi:uncharacterized membrane protein